MQKFFIWIACFLICMLQGQDNGTHFLIRRYGEPSFYTQVFANEVNHQQIISDNDGPMLTHSMYLDKYHSGEIHHLPTPLRLTVSQLSDVLRKQHARLTDGTSIHICDHSYTTIQDAYREKHRREYVSQIRALYAYMTMVRPSEHYAKEKYLQAPIQIRHLIDHVSYDSDTVDADTQVACSDLLAHNIMLLAQYDTYRQRRTKPPQVRRKGVMKKPISPEHQRNTYIQTVLDTHIYDHGAHFPYDSKGWHPLGYAIYTATATGVRRILSCMSHIPLVHEGCDLIPSDPLAYALRCYLCQTSQESSIENEYFHIIRELSQSERKCSIDEAKRVLRHYITWIYNKQSEIAPEPNQLASDIDSRHQQLFFPIKSENGDIPSMLDRYKNVLSENAYTYRKAMADYIDQIWRKIRFIQHHILKLGEI